MTHCSIPPHHRTQSHTPSLWRLFARTLIVAYSVLACMATPNMTLAEFNRWTNSTAFKQYKEDRGAGKVNAVVARTRRYLQGNASTQEQQKVESFISRMKADTAGERKYGEGRGKISARTASLLNWGWNPGVSF